MKTLSEKIIEQLQSKHDAFLGTEGELSRQRFKDGLSWAIDTVETLTEVDNCEKEHEAEQLRIAVVVGQSEQLCKGLHSTDFNGKCFKCGEQVFVREPK
jgi:hypothetical protein